jgi:hypothetical protein
VSAVKVRLVAAVVGPGMNLTDVGARVGATAPMVQERRRRFKCWTAHVRRSGLSAVLREASPALWARRNAQ